MAHHCSGRDDSSGEFPENSLDLLLHPGVFAAPESFHWALDRVPKLFAARLPCAGTASSQNQGGHDPSGVLSSCLYILHSGEEVDGQRGLQLGDHGVR